MPFIVVACGFYVITSQTGTKRDGVFLLILLMSDIMGMVSLHRSCYMIACLVRVLGFLTHSVSFLVIKVYK